MVIDEGGAEHDAEMGEDVAGTAYREALTSADGFSRGPNGRVKFNKDTKKRRREETEVEDVEMADAQPTVNKKEKRKHESKLGQEFKAKVRVRRFNFPGLSLTEAHFDRKRVVMLKRVGSTHTRTCPSDKLLRRRAGATALVSQARGKASVPLAIKS